MADVNGRNISEHPDHHAAEYRKIGTVLAATAHMGGIVETPEGTMAFEAGDYLVTDNPPTHLWPVKRDVFERTYVSAERATVPASDPAYRYADDPNETGPRRTAAIHERLAREFCYVRNCDVPWHMDTAERATVPAPAEDAENLASALLDAVAEAINAEAMPGNIHHRLKEAYNAVVKAANR